MNALNQAVDEFRGHPVAEEFGRVVADMNMGKTRVEAFQSMRDRLADNEITSIIGTIIQGSASARLWRKYSAASPMSCGSSARSGQKRSPARRV